MQRQIFFLSNTISTFSFPKASVTLFNLQSVDKCEFIWILNSDRRRKKKPFQSFPIKKSFERFSHLRSTLEIFYKFVDLNCCRRDVEHPSTSHLKSAESLLSTTEKSLVFVREEGNPFIEICLQNLSSIFSWCVCYHTYRSNAAPTINLRQILSFCDQIYFIVW